MKEILPGARRQEKTLVTPDAAIDFLGLDAARVLSTPRLIGLLEMTCRNLLAEMLPPGQDSVGTHVDLRHLAATPVGMQVLCQAEILSVEGRRVNFRVEAFDEMERIAEGTHQRFVVDVERFAARVRAKSQAPRPSRPQTAAEA